MNLLTWNIISNLKVILLPITQEVIDGVGDIAKKYGTKSPLKFKDRKEEPIREDYD